MDSPVILSPYNPDWTSAYEKERQAILNTAGPWIYEVQHIGSTSIPGLIAKPIIDILAAITSLDDAVHIHSPLVGSGYTYVPDYEDKLPERRFFNKHFLGNDGFHLHVVEKGSNFWRRHLAFRDYLISHPDAANEYAELKTKLAGVYRNDRVQYTDQKSDFIQKIERLAGVTPSSELSL
jgi:GrpB-like predicted nucleotidyltransferase (UPF0157 family)